MLDRDIFKSWRRVRSIDLSNNSFEGEVPITVSRCLHTYNVAGNYFNSWAGHHAEGGCPNDKPALELIFDRNEFTAFPPAMKMASSVTSVSMKNNMITELPPWGNFKAHRDTAVTMDAYLGLSEEWDDGSCLGFCVPNQFPLPFGPRGRPRAFPSHRAPPPRPPPGGLRGNSSSPPGE